MTPPIPERVADAYKRAPDMFAQPLADLRTSIFEAAENAKVGDVEETLKWGEISFLPKKPRIGTTIRLGWNEDTGEIRFYVPCQTRLIDIYKARFPQEFQYEGNRVVRIPIRDARTPFVSELIALAFTYHRDKLGKSL